MNSLRFQVCREFSRATVSDEEVRLVGRRCGKTIAICSASVSHGGPARVTYLRVEERYRRKKVATTLLQFLERELCNQGCPAMEALVIGNVLPEGVRELMNSQGWISFQVAGMVCATDVASLSRAPWVKFHKLPPLSSLFRWADLTSEDRHWVANGRASHQFPGDLDPLLDEHLIDPVSSFGLRSGLGVAGWCIFHGTRGNGVRCASLFIREDLRNRGYAMALVARSIRELARTCNRRIFFDVSLGRTQMITFFMRGLLPYIRALSFVNKGIKLLPGSAVAGERAG